MGEEAADTTVEVLEPLYARAVALEREAAVLLVHPLGLDHTIWEPVTEALVSRAAVVACDLRGHGRSPRAEHLEITSMAQDLLGLLDALGRERCVVAGLSLGGCVAQALALAAPERVDGLVLIDTTSWYGPKAVENWEGRIAQLEGAGFAGLHDFSLGRWFSPAFVAANALRAEAAFEVFLRNDFTSYRAACRALGALDLREHLASLGVPTAILVGSLDEATPLSFSEELHRRIAGSTLEVLEGAGHFSAIERPEAVVGAIGALLDAPAR